MALVLELLDVARGMGEPRPVLEIVRTLAGGVVHSLLAAAVEGRAPAAQAIDAALAIVREQDRREREEGRVIRIGGG